MFTILLKLNGIRAARLSRLGSYSGLVRIGSAVITATAVIATAAIATAVIASAAISAAVIAATAIIAAAAIAAAVAARALGTANVWGSTSLVGEFLEEN